MAKLLNAKTGKVEEVADDAVTRAVSSGAFSLPKGKVRVRDADGGAFELNAEEAQQAIQAGDFTFETRGERVKRLYGKSEGTAALAGAARGLSFGLSDALYSATGAASPEMLSGLEEANPAASLAGEGGAALATMLAGNEAGASGFASKAGALVRGVSRAGLGAEKLAAEALGKSLAGRVGAKAVGGAVEGGFYGMGRAVTDATISDTDLTAEKLLAGAGMGSLFGFGGAAAFGAGGELLGRRAGKVAAAASEVAPAPGVPPSVTASPGPVELASILRGAADDPVAAAAGAGKALEAGAEQHAGVIKRTLEALDLQFPTPEQLVLRDLDARFGEVKRLSRKGREESAANALLQDQRYASAKTMGEKLELIQSKLKEASLEQSDALSRIDAVANPSERFNVADVAKKIRSELIAPLKGGPALNEGTVKALEREVKKLEATGKKGITFVKAEEIKRGFDPHLSWDSKTDAVMKTKLRELRGIINREIESSAEEVAIRTGDLGLRDAWTKAKRLYGDMAELEKIASSRHDARMVSNRVFGLTDNIAGAASMAAGGGLNPLGLAAGAAGALVNKWGRERLPHVLAVTLHRMRSGSGGTVTKAFHKALSGSLREAPEKFGGYAGALSNAIARGVDDLLATHLALSETDPAYRTTMAKAGFAEETAEESAAIATKAARMDALERAVAKQDRELDDAVDGFFRKGGGVQTSPQPSRGLKGFEDVSAVLGQLTQHPEELAQRMLVGQDLADGAPAVATAASAAATRAVGFLHGKAPKPPPAHPVPGLEAPWRPSDIELSKFERYVNAVNDPRTVLADMQKGTVTKEAVEALRAVYPRLAEDLQGRFMQRLAGAKERLEYRKRLTLEQLFGGAMADPASSTRFGLLQGMHAQALQQHEAAQQGGQAPNVAGDMQSQAQRIEGRGTS